MKSHALQTRTLARSPRINPKATTLRTLAEFFNVPAGHLLGDDEPMTASREAHVMARSIEKPNRLDLDEQARDRLDFGDEVPAATTVWRLLTRLDDGLLAAVLAG